MKRKLIVVDLNELANKTGFTANDFDVDGSVPDGWSDQIMDMLEDLYGLERKLAKIIKKHNKAPKPESLFATLDELKAAVKAGNSVHWSSDDFLVVNRGNAWLIRRAGTGNPHEIGLTWSDGVTLNNHASLDDFYISNAEIIPYK